MKLPSDGLARIEFLSNLLKNIVAKIVSYSPLATWRVVRAIPDSIVLPIMVVQVAMTMQMLRQTNQSNMMEGSAPFYSITQC